MKINIAIATRGNDIYCQLLHFICKQFRKYDCGLITSSYSSSASIAQEYLFNSLTKTDADYHLLIDSDVCPPEDSLDKLLNCKEDIITAPVWHYDPNTKDIHLNVHYETKENLELIRVYKEKESGIEPIISASFACLLLSRRTLQVFRERKESPVRCSSLIEEKYRNCPDTDNIFFRKCLKLGLQPYVCWDVKNTVHHRYVDLCTKVVLNHT